ncbi:hypothetical protein BP5796_07216 [Coleophoma crateriformis]|uniref:Inheritance of peroxisomes protein 1 n=1 Tax=Coleophoma crateriformis TaxID=565419 RepID=A0A3D8RIQ6_9HELO|nr:hypothetical protein BP5796_07216 [Coleophoma crateriformis]
MAFPSPSPSRRSVSLPSTPAPAHAADQIETLYVLPFARIISFTTSDTVTSPGSRTSSPALEEQIGTLPYTSRFERTLAVGPLRIYRAPGSVAFLSCKSALRPILPRSQAWCVDEESSLFILQIKRPQYWRIEIPKDTAEDKIRSEELKDVLGKVLMFEKTACPFHRSFTVELPKAPETPIKKRPWKPVERARTASPPACRPSEINKAVEFRRATPLRSSSVPFLGAPLEILPVRSRREVFDEPEKESKPSLQSISETPIAARRQERARSYSPVSTSDSLNHSFPGSPMHNRDLNSPFDHGEDNDNQSDFTDDTNITPPQTAKILASQPEEIERLRASSSCSSQGAPPVLSLVTNAPSKQQPKSSDSRRNTVESNSSGSSSRGSFCSAQSWHAPLAPTPPLSPVTSEILPDSHNDSLLPNQSDEAREASPISPVPNPRVWDLHNESPTITDTIPFPSLLPTCDIGERSNDEQCEAITPTPSGTNRRHRATTSSNTRCRELSPLPPAVNLFSPQQRRRRLQTAHHLPTAIIQKTCEILLSPPSHLLQLMISIASKIAAGEWRGVLSGPGEAVHWDFSDDEHPTDGWEEDDFGISLPGTFESHASRRRSLKQPNPSDADLSWEID